MKQRTALTVAQKQQWDASICAHLWNWVSRSNPRIVHCYLPIGGEVDVSPFIQKLLNANIKVICPKTLPKRVLEHHELSALDETEAGLWGTRHPKEGQGPYTGNLDLIVVPGLAFDAKGFRLGYGVGYYDGFLADYPKSVTIGLAYPFQKISKVPVEAHDMALKAICLPDGILDLRHLA